MRGGVGAYTAELAHALTNAGVRVSVVTTQQAQTPLYQAAPVVIYPVIGRWGGRIWQQIPHLAQQIGATWLHVQYQTAAFAMNPAINLAPNQWRRYAKRHAYPLQVAWTYHDLLVPYLFPKAGTHLRRWVTLRPVQTSQLVIATNEGDYQKLAAATGPATRLKIPIGSNIQLHELAPEVRATGSSQRAYGDQPLLLGYFGFLNRSKGGLTLVQTLHELVSQGYNAHLLMIGEKVGASDPTNYAYLQEVEALIQQLGLVERVQWTGPLSDAEVSYALQRVSVLLMPYVDGASLRRGTLMAGLAHGCAIVTTTPQSPLPELVDGRDLLYVPPEAPHLAANAVRRLANEPALRQALQVGARRQSQRFTWSTIAANHIEAYTQCMA